MSLTGNYLGDTVLWVVVLALAGQAVGHVINRLHRKGKK